MGTTWGVRSDTEYDNKNRQQPMRLVDDRIANQDNEQGIVRTTDAPPTAMPPTIVMQRTVERNLNRYKPIKSRIVNQTERTIKMSNGAVLRKSGVALKRTNTPKKRAPGQIAAPPTPWDLKRKLLANQPSSSQGTTDTYKSTVGKQRKHQIRDNVEDSDEDDFYHWRRKYKRPKRRRVTRGRTPGERQETPSGGNRRRR